MRSTRQAISLAVCLEARRTRRATSVRQDGKKRTIRASPKQWRRPSRTSTNANVAVIGWTAIVGTTNVIFAKIARQICRKKCHPFKSRPPSPMRAKKPNRWITSPLINSKKPSSHPARIAGRKWAAENSVPNVASHSPPKSFARTAAQKWRRAQSSAPSAGQNNNANNDQAGGIPSAFCDENCLAR